MTCRVGAQCAPTRPFAKHPSGGDRRLTQIVLTSSGARETRLVGRRLGQVLSVGDVVALSGDLGAGKTCFVQGLAEGMGIEGVVTSPTFILMREHSGTPALCHADAYRLESPWELEDLGLEDILARCVLAIEWAERVADALPEERVEVALTDDGDDRRRITLSASGPRLSELLQEAFT